MKQRKWNRFSVGRAAVLARKGATRKQIVQHYLKHYGQKWGITTQQQMEQHLYKPARGMRPLPGKMFTGKKPEQIRKTYEEWTAKNQRTRRRMSKAHKGKKIGPQTREHKRNIAKALEGRKQAEETKQKIRATLKGRKLTKKHKRNIRIALQKPKTKRKMRKAKRGRTPTQETRQRMSAAKKGKKMAPLTKKHKQKIRKALKGRKLTKKHKRNIRIALQKPQTKQKLSTAKKAYWNKMKRLTVSPI